MKIRLLVLALFAAVTATTAQQTYTADTLVREAAFRNGEKFTFLLGWKFKGIMNANAGEITFTTSLTTVDGKQAYKVKAHGKTLPAIALFFKMDDVYETWLDMPTLRPLRFRSELKENKYRYKADYRYDWDSMKVHTNYHNLRKAPGSATMSLTPQSADAVAFFFNLRSQDVGSFTVGEYHKFDFVMDKKIIGIRFKLLGRETKKFGRLGTFRTLKLSCELTSTDDPDGQTFEDGTEFYIWLSDDRNHVPLSIESPTKIGSVVATIQKFEGLKYPLASRIKK